MLVYFPPSLTISVCCIYFLKIKLLVSTMSLQTFFSWPPIFTYNCYYSEYGFCLAINQCQMPFMTESDSQADSFLNFLY